MKLILVLILSTFAFSAMANDSASPKISVKGVDPMGLKSGAQFKVYGGNTSDLFEMFPGISSVMPEYDVEYAKTYRTLDIESNGWIVNVSCLKGAEAQNGAECTFSLNKKGADWENYGDTYDWAPSCSAVN